MSDIIYKSSAITLPVMPKEYRKYQTQNIDDAYDQMIITALQKRGNNE